MTQKSFNLDIFYYLANIIKKEKVHSHKPLNITITMNSSYLFSTGALIKLQITKRKKKTQALNLQFRGRNSHARQC